MSLHAQQLVYEQEGADAALRGEHELANPYDRDENSIAWNHWHYGHQVCKGELEILKRGTIAFYSTADWKEPLFTIPVDEAIRTGQWRPRFAGKST